VKLVVFGLAISSSWGNGHATLWRGLCAALARRGHEVVFFERDVPYYASTRDLTQLPYARLCLYERWEDMATIAKRQLKDADAAIVTSYCPDGVVASELVLDSPTPARIFYDLDTPMTLARLRAGEAVDYIHPRGLADFDLVLSYTGGRALEELRTRLGARRVAPLYGSVDADVYRPVAPVERYRADLSYMGTYAADRQLKLERLLIEVARRLPERKFLIGGAQYPEAAPWPGNICFLRHLPPAEHAAFYGSSRLTLNITRQAMAEMGWCPSGRLFEAAACGTAILSDAWDGLTSFFQPDAEILLARDTGDAIGALQMPDAELARIGRQARERTLAQHTADNRAAELAAAIEDVTGSSRPAHGRLAAGVG
jgi:spore maturation protein CgeB